MAEPAQSRRLRRSLLFVPGSEPRRLERARESGADTLLFDLEDSVAPDRKAEARELVAGALRGGVAGMAEGAVRVNPPDSPYFAEDLECVVSAGAAAVMLPKSESADRLRDVAARLDELERRAGRSPVRLLALVETAAGVVHAASLAAASARVEALCFGHADFSTDMGLAGGDASQGVVLFARCQVAVAAKACRVDPIDNVCLAVKDEAAFRSDAEHGLRLGFEGKMCIHPMQVRIANEVYTPSAEQVERARRIVEAYEDALSRGLGVFTIDGRMVDAPVVAAQKRLLERAHRARGFA